MIRLLIYTRETTQLDTYGDENIAITYNIDDITNLEEEYYALLDSYNNEVKDLKDENLWIKY